MAIFKCVEAPNFKPAIAMMLLGTCYFHTQNYIKIHRYSEDINPFSTDVPLRNIG